MRQLSVLLLICGTLLANPASKPSEKPITDADRVISIYTNDWRLGNSSDPKLIIAIWGDGSIVWSNDTLNGGAPYFTAQIEPEQVATALANLVEAGVFDIPQLRRARVGVDTNFTTILINHNRKKLRLDSTHELHAENKKRLSNLANLSTEDLHYRLCWLELRTVAFNLIPRAGDRTKGDAKMLHGKFSWNHAETE